MQVWRIPYLIHFHSIRRRVECSCHSLVCKHIIGIQLYRLVMVNILGLMYKYYGLR